MSCVASQWGCQWNVIDHTCSDMDDVVGTNIIKHRQVGYTKVKRQGLFPLRARVAINVGKVQPKSLVRRI